MGDLISREAAIEALNSNPNIRTIRGNVSGIWINLLDVIVEIGRVPTAKPVRRGKWVAADGMMPPEYHGKKRCSICAQFAMHDLYGRERLSHYCPNCGAKMDGDEK